MVRKVKLTSPATNACIRVGLLDSAGIWLPPEIGREASETDRALVNLSLSRYVP